MRFNSKVLKGKIICGFSLILNIILFIKIISDYSKLNKQDDIQKSNNGFISPLCQKFDQFDRLKEHDLSKKLSINGNFKNDIYNWDICASVRTNNNTILHKDLSNNTPIYSPIEYCVFHATFEQRFQYQFFQQEDSPNRMQRWSSCALLPPNNYRWPQKKINTPEVTNQSAVYWSNFGINSFENLTIFNPMFTKNIAHFDTAAYDIIHEKRVDIAAKYIPFAEKIRTMLDIGAGAGSVSFIVNKRYDVTVLNTVLPDFPYCEFISERGGLCILLDALKVLPFAKFSFDVIHHNWIFHSFNPDIWRKILLEQNRILRPGGYLWISDGLSFAQLKTIQFLLLKQLGYTILFENLIPQPVIRTNFGKNPYEVNWHAILVKPNRLTKQLHDCH